MTERTAASPPALTWHEHRDAARQALIAATVRELQARGPGGLPAAVVAYRADRDLRDRLPHASASFVRLVCLELRDLIERGIQPCEWLVTGERHGWVR